MKRVICLYRVSTTHQVEFSHDTDGDIPMQKNACHDFVAGMREWVIVDEFYEKGISGYKVSANDRDAIQDLKKKAERNEFDVLLVFKFDRLGRIDSETPFILEWFVEHGIEMWSTLEGQQKIETRSDKLINYLRFWQAGSESENTSQRVTEAMKQMVNAGKYIGGVTPFGYHTIKSGKENKRGKELLMLEIDEREAEAIRMIFRKTADEGVGSYRMSVLLNSQGYRMHSGAKFQCTSINRILSNPIYCGYFRFGEMLSPRQEYLQIIDDQTFSTVQEILQQRAAKDDEKRHIARTTKGNTMLSGNLICGHCGNRIISGTWWDNYKRKDGSKASKKRYRYYCYHKNRGLCDCDGAYAYTAEKVDAAVADIIKQYLDRIKVTPKDMALEQRYRRQIQDLQNRKRQLDKEHEKIAKRIQTLTDEIGKALTGESKFDLDTLSVAIENGRAELRSNEDAMTECARQLAAQRDVVDGLDGKYEQFLSWANEFDDAPLAIKKMIAGQLITKIEVRRGYDLTIYFNPTYEQFLEAESAQVQIAG